MCIYNLKLIKFVIFMDFYLFCLEYMLWILIVFFIFDLLGSFEVSGMV